MAFIQTVSPEEASGQVRQFYKKDLQKDGYIHNGTQSFSLRPQVFAVVDEMFAVIKANIDLRRYELVTTIAAAKLRCTY
jgi:hypothetical protein